MSELKNTPKDVPADMVAVAMEKIGIDADTARRTAIPALSVPGVEQDIDLIGAYVFSAGGRGGMSVLVSETLEALAFASCVSCAEAARRFCAGERS